MSKLHKDEVVTDPPLSLYDTLKAVKEAKIGRENIQSLKIELEKLAGVGA